MSSQFREIPAAIQTLYPIKSTTKEALEHARMLMPSVELNTFMQAMLVYHNSLITQMGKTN